MGRCRIALTGLVVVLVCAGCAMAPKWEEDPKTPEGIAARFDQLIERYQKSISWAHEWAGKSYEWKTRRRTITMNYTADDLAKSIDGGAWSMLEFTVRHPEHEAVARVYKELVESLPVAIQSLRYLTNLHNFWRMYDEDRAGLKNSVQSRYGDFQAPVGELVALVTGREINVEQVVKLNPSANAQQPSAKHPNANHPDVRKAWEKFLDPDKIPESQRIGLENQLKLLLWRDSPYDKLGAAYRDAMNSVLKGQPVPSGLLPAAGGRAGSGHKQANKQSAAQRRREEARQRQQSAAQRRQERARKRREARAKRRAARTKRRVGARQQAAPPKQRVNQEPLKASPSAAERERWQLLQAVMDWLVIAELNDLKNRELVAQVSDGYHRLVARVLEDRLARGGVEGVENAMRLVVLYENQKQAPAQGELCDATLSTELEILQRRAAARRDSLEQYHMLRKSNLSYMINRTRNKVTKKRLIAARAQLKAVGHERPDEEAQASEAVKALRTRSKEEGRSCGTKLRVLKKYNRGLLPSSSEEQRKAQRKRVGDTCYAMVDFGPKSDLDALVSQRRLMRVCSRAEHRPQLFSKLEQYAKKFRKAHERYINQLVRKKDFYEARSAVEQIEDWYGYKWKNAWSVKVKSAEEAHERMLAKKRAKAKKKRVAKCMREMSGNFLCDGAPKLLCGKRCGHHKACPCCRLTTAGKRQLCGG